MTLLILHQHARQILGLALLTMLAACGSQGPNQTARQQLDPSNAPSTGSGGTGGYDGGGGDHPVAVAAITNTINDIVKNFVNSNQLDSLVTTNALREDMPARRTLVFDSRTLSFLRQDSGQIESCPRLDDGSHPKDVTAIEEYQRRMRDAHDRGFDTEFTTSRVAYNQIEKTCVFFGPNVCETESTDSFGVRRTRPLLRCNLCKLKDILSNGKNPPTEAQLNGFVRLLHHELAGMAAVESPEGENESNYQFTRQIPNLRMALSANTITNRFSYLEFSTEQSIANFARELSALKACN